MSSPFDEAFEATIGHEGGYVNDPRDPGGETKFGISKQAYPGEDIPNMTLERAKELYRRDYWDKARCAEFPAHVALQLFDAAVNHGVTAAVKILQGAVGVARDGKIGPRTIHASRVAREEAFHALFNATRLEFYTGLRGWDAFGRGWARRIAENLRLPYVS